MSPAVQPHDLALGHRGARRRGTEARSALGTLAPGTKVVVGSVLLLLMLLLK